VVIPWRSRYAFVDAAIQHQYLVVERDDEVPQRLDPQQIRVTQLETVEELRAGEAEQIRHRDPDPFFGEHRMHLAFESRTQVDQLVAIADQLA
jgi:hypothetical protein